MNIVHYKNTRLAYAPEAISSIINKYSEHNSFVFGHDYGNINIKYDILHLHNRDAFPKISKRLIQYHSEPWPNRVDLNTDAKKLVIAQYHATLPEYKNCTIVRNPIDIYDTIFEPKYYDKKIRIGYSPSATKKVSKWYDKGYIETTKILTEIKDKHKIDIDIIHGVSLEECIRRKSQCNIVIDEVKTGSYHRSGLEGLALGCATICNISDSVADIIKNTAGHNHPFINCNMDTLHNTIENLINSGINNILQTGNNSRLWMEKYWNPKNILKEYLKAYE